MRKLFHFIGSVLSFFFVFFFAFWYKLLKHKW